MIEKLTAGKTKHGRQDSSKEASSYQSRTIELYELLETQGEKNALEVLKARSKDSSSSDGYETDQYAFEKFETTVLKWRNEFPKAARYFDQIVDLNKGLIGKNVKPFQGQRVIEREDLFSAGRIGLWRAIINYDVSTEYQFSTYATHCIKNELLSFINKKRSRDAFRLSRARSLDAPVRSRGDNEVNLHQRIEDEKSDSPLENIFRKEQSGVIELIKKAIETDLLTDRERLILSARFELLADRNTETETFEEISKRFGVTRERIRQIEAEALAKIANFVEEYDYEVDSQPVVVTEPKKAKKRATKALKLSLAADLICLKPRQRLMIARRVAGKTYPEIANDFGCSVPSVAWQLTTAYKLLGINTNKHPDDEQYLNPPEGIHDYDDVWHTLTSYQRAVMFFSLQGLGLMQIVDKVNLSKGSVNQLLRRARKKLGIDIHLAPAPYNKPPSGCAIDQSKWDSLTVFQRKVAWETLVDPKKTDKELAEKFAKPTSRISQARSEARKRLGNKLPKIILKIGQANKHRDKQKDYQAPPEGFEFLSEIWGKLTPGQKCVAYYALQENSVDATAKKLGFTRSQVKNLKRKAMLKIEPLLCPKPSAIEISDADWNRLGVKMKKAAISRSEHPEWSLEQIAKTIGGTALAARKLLLQFSKLIGTFTQKTVEAKYHKTPISSIPQSRWSKLLPRHLAITWESVKHPDWSFLKIANQLGIVKKTPSEIEKYVRKMRGEAAKILGIKIDKPTPLEVLTPPSGHAITQADWDRLSRPEKIIVHAALSSRTNDRSKSIAELAEELGYKSKGPVWQCLKTGGEKLGIKI